MNDEIKEIIEWLEDEDIYVEDYGYKYKRMSLREVKILLDYITNLQKEYEELKGMFGIWNNRKLIKKFNKEYDKEDKRKNPNKDYVVTYPDAEEEQKEKYKQQIIDEKLEEKYVGKPIMLYRGKDGWIKTKGKEVFATEDGIYIMPYFNGHICKLSREGKTWKMWSELEELEEEKKKLEKRIKELKKAGE